MKASFLLTTASLICLLLPQANARVLNIKETKLETHTVIANESLQLVANETTPAELLKTFERMGVSAALATNEREFRSLPGFTTSSDCAAVKELEESKCELKVREISLFDEKEKYLVCTVASVFKCTKPSTGKPLDFQF